MIPLGAALLLALSAAGCGGDAAQAPAEPEASPNAPALRVRVEPVALGALSERIVLRGTVLPARDVTFSAEMPGRVEALTVDHGDRVRKGQVLARIDYALQLAQRDQARAGHELAVKTLERLDKLRADDMVSQQDLDQARTQVLTSKAALAITEAQLGKSVVRSTISGIVARRHADAGEYANPGVPLVQVVDFSTVKVSAQVAETDAARVRRGLPTRVRFDALGREVDGKVHVLMPAAHHMSNTYELRVKLPNPDHAILVGMAATVSIDVAKHDDVVVVEQDAVVESESGRAVFIEVAGKAKRRPVVLGAIEGDRVIVAEGLSPGDKLVVEGQRTLHDGQEVRSIVDSAVADEPPRAPAESEGS